MDSTKKVTTAIIRPDRIRYGSQPAFAVEPATMAPTALPMVMPMPTMPETPPRRAGGNRSGTNAVAAA